MTTNLFAAIAVFAVSIAGISCIAPANDETGHKMIFETHDSGMAWPFTDVNEPNHGPDHGIHCENLTLEFAAKLPQDLHEQMHFEHCRRLVIKMADSIRSQPEVYKISPLMCTDLLRPKTLGGKQFGSYFRIAYMTYYICQLYKDGCNEQGVPEDIYKKIANEMYLHAKGESTSQQELLYMLGGTNFGELLWRGYLDQSLLTKDERDFYSGLESPHVVRLGSLGIVCSHGADTAKAEHSLETAIKASEHVPVGVDAAFKKPTF